MKLNLTTLAALLMAGSAMAQTTVQSCDREVTFDAPPQAAISNDVNLTEMMLVLALRTAWWATQAFQVGTNWTKA